MTTEAKSQQWLLLVHQLPSQPSKLRVKVWRRLQGVGAVLVKNSVYVLPNSSETREHLEWIRGEIISQGGEAAVFTAEAVDQLTTDEVINAFVAARREDWDELQQRAEALQQRHAVALEGESTREELEREIKALRNRAAQIDKIDYFHAPGRQEGLGAIEIVAGSVRFNPPEAEPTGPILAANAYRSRRWLTRPRPGVDRMASAWLIRRFIDPDAEFCFSERIPTDEEVVPFDMFGVEFGHHGKRCTFETLLQRFGHEDPALTRISTIVHDLDLHTDSATDSETSVIGRLVDGLREASANDPELLDRGIALFEALYRSFKSESPGS